jgi:hypothetical protein
MYHLDDQPIPPGLQIFEERLEVSGVRFRREDATALAEATGAWLELEADENNQYDKYAIKVIGCLPGMSTSDRRFIGYVPKEVSAAIANSGFSGQVRARLLMTYVGDSGFVEILFQLLGPKGQKWKYQRFSATSR